MKTQFTAPVAVSHTPGPWRINDRIHANVLEGDYRTIDGGFGYHDEEKGGFGIATYLTLADARLIAAAPEMLAALKLFIEAEERNGFAARIQEKNPDTIDDGEACYSNTFEAALKAIAKATGES